MGTAYADRGTNRGPDGPDSSRVGLEIDLGQSAVPKMKVRTYDALGRLGSGAWTG